MKKLPLKILLLAPLFITLNGCSLTTKSSTIEAYASIVANNSFFSEYDYTMSGPVYHVDKAKQLMQPQPYQSDNKIYNVDSEWREYKSFELLTIDYVYDRVYNFANADKIKLVNDNKIDIYIITYHTKLFGTIYIDEIFVINILDITTFEFNYKVAY